MPGVGALAAAGIGWIWPENLQKQVTAELSEAIAAARVEPEGAGRGGRIKRLKVARRQKKQVKGVAGKVGFSELMRPAPETGKADDPAQEPGPAQPDKEVGVTPEERHRAVTNLATVARAQLEASATPLPVPGSWRDRFAELLETTATANLDDPHSTQAWCGLLTSNETGPRPDALAIEEWAILVTRIFAARIMENGALRPYALELKEQDRLALQLAMLARLDGQRQALHAVAAVVAFAALGLGLDIALT